MTTDKQRIAKELAREVYDEAYDGWERVFDFEKAAEIILRALAHSEQGWVSETLRSIIANDKTEYEHHERRKSDGKSPSEDGGTCFMTPKELAEIALRRLSPPLSAPQQPEVTNG